MTNEQIIQYETWIINGIRQKKYHEQLRDKIKKLNELEKVLEKYNIKSVDELDFKLNREKRF